MSLTTRTLVCVLVFSTGAAPSFACPFSRQGGGRTRSFGGGVSRARVWQSGFRMVQSRRVVVSNRSYRPSGFSSPTYSEPRHIRSHPHFSEPSISTPPSFHSTPSHFASAPRQMVGPSSVGPRAVSPPHHVIQPSVGSTRPTAPQPERDAATSALDRLRQLGEGDSSLPQFQPSNPSTPDDGEGHLGTWSARLPNKVFVSLELQSNGMFRWVATQDGKVSSFEGSYSLAGSRLTLVRTDSQQLRGDWTAIGDGAYRFRVDDAKDGGLEFSRA